LFVIAGRQSDRSTIADSCARRKEVADAAETLRLWYETDILENEYRGIGRNNNSMHSIAVSSHMSSTQHTKDYADRDIKSNISLTASSYVSDPRGDNPVTLVPKPVAASPIQPLGRKNPNATVCPPPSILDRCMTPHREIIKARARVKAPLRGISVYQSIAQTHFLQAAGWVKQVTQHPMNKLQANNRWNEIYCDYSTVESFHRDNLRDVVIDDYYDIHHNEEFSHNRSCLSTTKIIASGHMPSLPNASSSRSEYTIDRTITCLSDKQVQAFVLSIVADTVQACVLSLLCLARHAWASKTLSLEDIAIVLGSTITNSLETVTVARLQRWLEANRRSEMTFRLSTETLAHLDTALQQSSGFWPSLAIKRNNDKNCACVTRLAWKDRKFVEQLFHDPNSFEPNINCM